MMLRCAAALAALVGVGLPISTGAAAQEVKARLGTSLPDSHPQTIGARKFADLAEAKTNGRIRITVYPGAVLGSDVQMTGALRGGTQEFTVPSTATLAGVVPGFGIIGLPFSFATETEADGVLDGPFGRDLFAALPAKGLVGLAFWENGFRHITNSRRPIQGAADLKGLKIRTMQNPLYIDIFNGLGSNAVPMGVQELFPALEVRAVDGQENPLTVIHAQKFYDVQKYLSTTGHTYDALVLLASKRFWDKLDDATRRGLEEAAREATLFQRGQSRTLNASLRGELAKTGMAINDVSVEERERMRDGLKPVIEKHAAQFGDDLVERFRSAVEVERRKER